MTESNYSYSSNDDATLDHIFAPLFTLNESIYDEENDKNGTMGDSNMRNEELAKIEIAVLAVIFSITVLGNIIVLLGIYFRRQKMTRMYYFILHLTLADFITAFFNVLAQLIWEVTHRFQGGNFLCKFIKYMQILGPYSSSYVLVMTALDRYQAICHPLTNSTWTANRSKWMLAVAWGLSMVFCVPQVFIFSYQEVPNTTECDCWATFVEGGEKVYVTWYCISVFIIPLIILIFAYTCITRAIWLSFSQQSSSQRRRRLKSVSDSDSESDNSRKLQSVNRHGKVTLRYFQRKFRLTKNQKNGCHGKTIEHHEPEEASLAIVVQDKGDETISLASVVKGQNGGPNGQNNAETGYVMCGENSCNETSFAKDDQDSKLDKDGKLLPLPMKLLVVSSDGKQKKVKSTTSSSSKLSSPKFKSRDDKGLVPRVHSVAGISRAKIKTVKLTVTIIICYIVCSSPFIGAQLWCYYDPLAKESPFYTGTTFTILTLLASLNSCVNPWIFLFFNPNLLQNVKNGLSCWERGQGSPNFDFGNSRSARANTLRSKNSLRHVNSTPLSANTGSTMMQSSPLLGNSPRLQVRVQ